MAALEQRFIFHHRLFEHMATFRAAGYRYYFTPADLAYVKDGATVRTFELEEIVFATPKRNAPSEWVKPDSVDFVAKQAGNRTTYSLKTEPDYTFKIGKKATEVMSPNGNPFAMSFKGTSLAPGSRLTSGTGPAAQVPSINCCTSTLAAFHTEWKRVMHAGDEPESAAAKLRRLPKKFLQYFIVSPDLPDWQGAGSVACDLEAGLIVRDGDKSWLSDLRDMRRGDIGQVYWYGQKPLHWEAFGAYKDENGKDQTGWHHVKDEPANADDEHKRQRRDFNYAGHSVFIHDVVLRDGEVWFHMLSAQGNDLRSGGTRGIGLAGSGRDAYAVGNPALEAELFSKAKCYRYKQDDHSDPYGVIPELFVGRLRRPFPCWPIALPGEPADKVPLPKAFQRAGYKSNLHDDDVRYASATAYTTNCENAGSGFYPMGLSRSWHGGVHLTADAGTPVRAIADGVIVAVRCAVEPGGGPSRNFVLVRHQVADGDDVKVFHSLAMHLRGEKAKARPLEPRWLWQFDQKPKLPGHENADARALADAGVVCMAYPIGAGEIIGHTQGAYVHIEVFAGHDIVDASYPGKQLLEDGDGDLLYDSKKLLALLAGQGELDRHLKALMPGPGAAQSGVVLQDEIKEFFTTGCEQPRAALRGLVTRHLSEWSSAARWPDLRDTEAWGYYDTAAAQSLEKAQSRCAWLTGPVAAWSKLPASGMLYHYHPIAFIEWLADKTTSGAIRPLVQKVSEILAQGPAPAAHPDPQEPDSTPQDPVEDAPAASRWEIEPATNLAQLAVGTLGADGSFERKDREPGPWTQIGASRTNAHGHSEFVQVDAGRQLWICVESRGTRYARKVH